MTLTEIKERELVQLAKDIVANKVFTSAQIDSSMLNNIGMIFLPLIFIDPEVNKLPEDVCLLYEYYSEAIAGRAINGYPCFGSFRYLTKEECDFTQTKCEEIKKLLDSI